MHFVGKSLFRAEAVDVKIASWVSSDFMCAFLVQCGLRLKDLSDV